MGVAERRKREKEARRELAIEAAVRIFDEEGYHAITMEKIAKNSELSRAALYLYFKNKNEILVSAIVEHIGYFIELLQAVHDRKEDLKENVLNELWEAYRKFYEKDTVVFNISLYFHQSEIMHNLSQDLFDILYKADTKAVNLQHRTIEYGVNNGIFIESNPMTLTEVIWTSFSGMMQLARSKQMMGRKEHLAVTRNLAIRILARGVLKHPENLNSLEGIMSA